MERTTCVGGGARRSGRWKTHRGRRQDRKAEDGEEPCEERERESGPALLIPPPAGLNQYAVKGPVVKQSAGDRTGMYEQRGEASPVRKRKVDRKRHKVGELSGVLEQVLGCQENVSMCVCVCDTVTPQPGEEERSVGHQFRFRKMRLVEETPSSEDIKRGQHHSR